MAIVINQETFDAVVEETITELGMSREEAIEDAIKQFQLQGVDLSNILKKTLILNPDDSQVLSTAIVELGKLIKSKNKVPSSDYENKLSFIKTECDKGLEYKVLAGKEGAYSIILDILLKHLKDLNLTKVALSCMLSLVTQQPDLLDASGIQAMIGYLDKCNDPEVHGLVLRWIKACCVMHEENRQKIFDAEILNRLKILLDKQNAEILQDILAVIRALVLDDDVRVEFGKAHEYSRIIANNTLRPITAILCKSKQETLIIDVLHTISSLLVRTEFCCMVKEAGGLNAVKDIMITFSEKDKVIKHCFKLLKGLSGDDEVKVDIIQQQLAPVITTSLDMHKGSVETAGAGLACIAALSLRSPENSKALYDAGAPEVIVNVMKQHLGDANIQRNGSWAVRNMVSRSRYQNEMFLEFGIEEILIQSIKTFPKYEYDIKSALRDLGCKVQLKEEWTGKGGRLNTEAK